MRLVLRLMKFGAKIMCVCGCVLLAGYKLAYTVEASGVGQLY